MKEDIYRYRTNLLKTFSEKKYSQLAKHEIMLYFGNIDPNLKEEVAKQSIPLVRQSKTEQEAITKVKELVNKMSNK